MTSSTRLNSIHAKIGNNKWMLAIGLWFVLVEAFEVFAKKFKKKQSFPPWCGLRKTCGWTMAADHSWTSNLTWHEGSEAHKVRCPVSPVSTGCLWSCKFIPTQIKARMCETRLLIFLAIWKWRSSAGRDRLGLDFRDGIAFYWMWQTNSVFSWRALRIRNSRSTLNFSQLRMRRYHGRLVKSPLKDPVWPIFTLSLEVMGLARKRKFHAVSGTREFLYVIAFWSTSQKKYSWKNRLLGNGLNVVQVSRCSNLLKVNGHGCPACPSPSALN